MWRKKQFESNDEAEYLRWLEQSKEHAKQVMEIADTVREAFAELSPRELEAINLLAEGLSFREAQVAMNISNFAFQTIVARARCKILGYLAENASGL